MELTVVAILVLTFEVVDAIGDIARLLDLAEEASLADAVDTSGGEKEAVAFLHVVVVDSVHDRIVGYHLLILLGSDLLLQSHEHTGIEIRVHDIPHLGLAALLALLMRNLVGRMHLDGQWPSGIDELDEQWKFIAETLIVGGSHQFLFHICHDSAQRLTGIFSFADDGLIAGNTGDLPALSHVFEIVVEMLERDDLVATPKSLLQQRLKT